MPSYLEIITHCLLRVGYVYTQYKYKFSTLSYSLYIYVVSPSLLPCPTFSTALCHPPSLSFVTLHMYLPSISLPPLLLCLHYFIYPSPPIPQTDKPTHSRWPSLPTLHWSTTLEQVVVEGQYRVIYSTCASFAMQHACIMHTYNRLDTALCNFRTTYIHTYVLPNCCVVMLFSLSINSLRYCGNSK